MRTASVEPRTAREPWNSRPEGAQVCSRGRKPPVQAIPSWGAPEGRRIRTSRTLAAHRAWIDRSRVVVGSWNRRSGDEPTPLRGSPHRGAVPRGLAPPATDPGPSGAECAGVSGLTRARNVGEGSIAACVPLLWQQCDRG